MLSGLLAKTLRETRVVIALCCLALGLTVGLFLQILPQFQEGLSEMILQMPIFRTMISGLMGMDVSGGISSRMLLAVVWVHPIVLSIVWGCAIALCTRVPAGEVEHGTIDVLLGWPVSRGGVWLAETLVWVAAGVALLACGLLGFLISAQTLPAEQRPELGPTLLALLSFFVSYLLVGAAAQCLTALSDRRGKAMGLAIAFVLASYLVNFLSQFWAPAKYLVTASFVRYYRPAELLLQGRMDWTDLAVLLVASLVLWSIGLAAWCRRSVLTI